LRDMFHDDLLIRTANGYEPTPKGQRLLQDLATMLPRLDRLMAGERLRSLDRGCYFSNRGYRACRTPARTAALQICSLETHKSRLQLCPSPRRAVRGVGERQARSRAECGPRHVSQ
jgi:hypothetical protein